MKKQIKTLFTSLFTLTFLFVLGNLQAQTTMEEFLSKWRNGKQFTIDVLNAMPESGMDYKTDPEAMSFKEQIHHIASSAVGIAQGYLMGKDPGFSIDVATASKAELADYVAKAYDYAEETMRALPADKAGEVIEVFGMNASRRQIMALIMDHSTHHRGSAIAYLRASGVTPPAFVGF
ncbi:MAG: DinB family protein [Cyclobacteriaceae bacterium]|nr:DinB family protein [Cyclobacteriaceae bacterium]